MKQEELGLGSYTVHRDQVVIHTIAFPPPHLQTNACAHLCNGEPRIFHKPCWSRSSTTLPKDHLWRKPDPGGARRQARRSYDPETFEMAGEAILHNLRCASRPRGRSASDSFPFYRDCYSRSRPMHGNIVRPLPDREIPRIDS